MPNDPADDLDIFDVRIPVDGEALRARVYTDVPPTVGNKTTISLATTLDPNTDRNFAYRQYPHLEMIVTQGTIVYTFAIARDFGQPVNQAGDRNYTGAWRAYLNVENVMANLSSSRLYVNFKYGDNTFSVVTAGISSDGEIGVVLDFAMFQIWFLQQLNTLSPNIYTNSDIVSTTVSSSENYDLPNLCSLLMCDANHVRVTGNGLFWKPNQIRSPEELSFPEGAISQYPIHLRYPPIDGNVLVAPVPEISGPLVYDITRLSLSDLGPGDLQIRSNVDEDHVDYRHTFQHQGLNSIDVFLNNDSIQITALDPQTPHVLLTRTILRLVDGGTTSYGIRLSTQPAHNVVITITRGEHTGNLNVNKSMITFTPSNWDIVQTITVVSVMDILSELHYAVFEHSANSTDEGYDNIPITNVLALEVDSIQPVVTQEGPEIPLPPGNRRGVVTRIPSSRLPNEGYIEEIKRKLVADTIEITVREEDFLTT